jgi:DNA polymerase-3 subunit alpha
MIKNNADFVHLHCHSEFSRFDGLAKMGDLVLHARKMGFKSLALTDHGNVGGWIKFYQECKKKKGKDDKPLLDAQGNPLAPLKPILGCEFYLARHHEAKEQPFSVTQPDGRKGNRHIVLIAKNQIGYQNLCALSQRSWTHGQHYDPRIDLELLAKHSEGLICSSACLSSVVNNNLLHGRYDQAKRVATILKDIFGKDFFLEVMFHGIDSQGYIIPDVIRLGLELDIPVIASNDCHYIRKEQAESQTVLMAMSQSKCLKDPKLLKHSYDEFYLKSAAEMAKVFGSKPEFLLNTVAVSERIEDFLKVGGMRLPVFDIEKARQETVAVELASDLIQKGAQYLKDIVDGNLDAVHAAVREHTGDVAKFEKSYQLMHDLVYDKYAEFGMKRLGWDTSQPHMAAAEKEMGDVRIAWEANRMDFATYFLIVWDYIDWSRRNKIITGCGRGSGYASVVLRALRICYGPDPLKYGLLWERFLGFDDKFYLTDSDWGFGNIEVTHDVDALAGAGDDVMEERVVEDDQGGVDRY